MPNSAAHPAVKQYLKGVTEEQLKACVIPKQAKPIFVCDLTALCQVIDSKLQLTSTSPIHLYIYACDKTDFKLHVFSGNCSLDLSHIKAVEIAPFPYDKGLIFHHVFGNKTLCLCRHQTSKSISLPSKGIRQLYDHLSGYLDLCV